MAAFIPIALTTVFTPPATCTSLTPAGPSATDQYYHEYNPSEVTGTWTSCYPSGITHSSTSGYLTDTYFSPGVCPSGFTMCDSQCISEYVGFWGLALSSETGGRCCLSNWSVVPYKGYCTTVSSGSTITALGVEVRWKSTDLYLFDPNSPGMAKQVSASTLLPSTTATSESSSIPSRPNTAATSSSVVIGGAVGGALGAIIIALVVVLLLILKRRQTKRKPTSSEQAQSIKPELDGQNYSRETGNECQTLILTASKDEGGLPLELAINHAHKSTTHYEIDAKEPAVYELETKHGI